MAQRTIQQRGGELLFVVMAWAAMFLPMILVGAFLWASLTPAARSALLDVLSPHVGLALLLAAILSVLAAAAARYLWRLYAGEMLRLAEDARLIVGPNPSHRPTSEGVAAARALAAALGELADQRDAARRDVEEEIRRARENLELERNRLAALVAELPMPVIVCALDGRILLYNNRARLQAKALAQVGHASTAIGLGRSIYALFEPSQIAHGLEVLQHRLEREGSQPVASFVTTTRAGQLIRVQMAPVAAPAASSEKGPLAGFVLVLENVTRAWEANREADRLWLDLIEKTRSTLAHLRTTLARLGDDSVRATDAMRREIDRLAAYLQQAEQEQTRHQASRWPLDEIAAYDLGALIARRIEKETGLRVKTECDDAQLWLRVDSFSLSCAITHLALRLLESTALKLVHLRIRPYEQEAAIELSWSGRAFSSETLLSWQSEPIVLEGTQWAFTLRDIVERHGGHFAQGRDSASQTSFFRLTLPRAAAQGVQETSMQIVVESRPEFYDFDLFQRQDEDHALDEMPLTALTYTVFDTETTGLEPSAGDEIIQIGAVRVVNGRLLRHENFEQLIDPRRPIPKAGIAVHGITDEMVRGQPTIDAVLPEFHAFAAGTVLVAHNAAFDMRFLELKEARLGIRFNQPVLDTLLLDAVVHPHQESHKLEAIAERLGVAILGRHTALGDAIVTAEVFLKLLPLLAAQGIRTLREAREASQKTYYARLKY
ncbi:MAG: exonuclease domain-containing protein [Rhodocyclaceae bacterium]|nr:exonuclease domain-containing protein [Rhodocyclaceae bacterium]